MHNNDENDAMVQEIVRRTALPYAVVDGLLQAGWAYTESMKEPNKWVKMPYVNVERKK